MPTNTALITDSLGEIGAVADGQTASASDLADGLKALNRMMAIWTEDSMDIGWFPQDTGSDTIPIPVWAEEAVQANLGLKLCSLYRITPTNDLINKAVEGIEFVAKKVINHNLEGVDMDHMPYGVYPRWNVDTDNF